MRCAYVLVGVAVGVKPMGRYSPGSILNAEQYSAIQMLQ